MAEAACELAAVAPASPWWACQRRARRGLVGVVVLPPGCGFGLRLDGALFGHGGVDGYHLGRPSSQDEDLEQILTRLDRAVLPQLSGSFGEEPGGAEKTRPDDTGVGPQIGVGFDHGDHLLDAAETGEGEGPPPVLELLVAMVGHGEGVLQEVEQFRGPVEQRTDEGSQEVGAVVPAEKPGSAAAIASSSR